MTAQRERPPAGAEGRTLHDAGESHPNALVAEYERLALAEVDKRLQARAAKAEAYLSLRATGIAHSEAQQHVASEPELVELERAAEVAKVKRGAAWFRCLASVGANEEEEA